MKVIKSQEANTIHFHELDPRKHTILCFIKGYWNILTPTNYFSEYDSVNHIKFKWLVLGETFKQGNTGMLENSFHTTLLQYPKGKLYAFETFMDAMKFYLQENK